MGRQVTSEEFLTTRFFRVKKAKRPEYGQYVVQVIVETDRNPHQYRWKTLAYLDSKLEAEGLAEGLRDVVSEYGFPCR